MALLAAVALALFIHFRLRQMEKNMATQVDVDALTASVNTLTENVTTLSTTLTGENAEVRAELDALEAAVAAGQPVDLTALKAAVDRASAAGDAIAAAVADTAALVEADAPADGEQPAQPVDENAPADEPVTGGPAPELPRNDQA